MKKAKSFTLIILGLFLLDITIFAVLPQTWLIPSFQEHSKQGLESAAILFNSFNETKTGINIETARRVDGLIPLLTVGDGERLEILSGLVQAGIDRAALTG